MKLLKRFDIYYIEKGGFWLFIAGINLGGVITCAIKGEWEAMYIIVMCLQAFIVGFCINMWMMTRHIRILHDLCDKGTKGWKNALDLLEEVKNVQKEETISKN